MIFAGHPTVGTSFVLLEEGMVPKNCERFSLEEKIGAVADSRRTRRAAGDLVKHSRDRY